MEENKHGTLGHDYFIGIFYTSCIHESGFELISLHKTKKSAVRAMNNLKFKHFLEDNKSINFMLSDSSFIDFLTLSREDQEKSLKKIDELSLFDSVDDYINVMTHKQGRIPYFENNDMTAYCYKIIYVN